MQQGHLPVLAELMRQGSYAPLRSVYPVLSSAAWSSFMTGLNPGKHGIYDFVIRDPTTYQLRPVSRLQMHGRSLWRMVSDQGLRVGVINVPMTYPPEPVNGFLISGLGTPNYQPFTYPLELGDDLLRSGYRVNRRVFRQGEDGQQAFLDDTYEISDHLTASALQLMGEQPWDLFVVVYRDSDEVAHQFWSYMDETHPVHDPGLAESYGTALLECYQRLDASLGRLIEAAGPNCTVFVVSDHGTGPLYRDVFLNEWLSQQGFLARNRSAAHGLRAPNGPFGYHLVQRVQNSACHRTRKSKNMRSRPFLGDAISVLPRDSWGDLAEVIDWQKTRLTATAITGRSISMFVEESHRVLFHLGPNTRVSETKLSTLCTRGALQQTTSPWFRPCIQGKTFLRALSPIEPQT